MNPFEHLITDLGRAMNLPLRADDRLACRLKFSDDLTLQLELDRSGERILLGTELGQLPQGKYREQILFQAMIVNGLLGTPKGILAYSPPKNALILFQYFPVDSLNGEALFKFLTSFHDHALVWKTALERSEIPEIEEQSVKHSGIFGLQP